MNLTSCPRGHGLVLASCLLRTCTRTQHRGTRTRLQDCFQPRYPIVRTGESVDATQILVLRAADAQYNPLHRTKNLATIETADGRR